MEKKLNRKVETGNQSENGASPKNLLGKRTIFVLLLTVSVFIMYSCQVISIIGRHAILSDNSSYSSVTYQSSMPVTRKSPFELNYSFGVGFADLNEMEPFSNFNIGLGMDYFFSRGRFQPYIGLILII